MPSLSTPRANATTLAMTENHIGGLLDKVLLSDPDKVAIKFQSDEGVSETTFGDLDTRINQLAARLKDNGVSAGDKVGIYFNNHPDFVTGYFAILKAGAIVVAINPLLRSNEIKHILSDSQASYLIASHKLIRAFDEVDEILTGLEKTFVICPEKVVPDDCGKLHFISSPNLSLSLNDGTRLDNLKSDDDLAVLVYTSGTTGNPKGAMLTHGNLLAAVEMKRTSFIVEPDDCVLAVLPLCHIYGMVVVMMGTLVEGARLSVMETFEPREALKRIEEDSVSVLPAVPAMYQFMYMQTEEPGFKYDTSSLKYCVTGGAPIDPELRVKVEEAFGTQLLEGYALTEVSCVATLTPLGGVRKAGSCGPKIQGVDLKILDRKTKEVLAPGSQNVGEVVIGGPHVMKGYFRNEEASRDSFHNGLFLTGDLGYLDEDGYLYICGRTKELIIRGGQNIYPREVESAILNHGYVADAAVVGVADKFMGERVKAVIVLKPGKVLSEAELEEHTKKILAPYKVPRIWEFRDELPRNSTGKVLKRLLI